jgi:predicted nucleotidyltransferase
LAASRGASAGAAHRDVDAATREALGRLGVCLRARYGDRLKGLILFGSRARGDHRPDSDADLAVVLEGPIERPFAIKSEIIDDAYDIFLDTGIDIQPWPIDAASLRRPESHRNPRLIRAILRDGIEL